MAIGSKLYPSGNLTVKGSLDEITNNPTTTGSIQFNGTSTFLTAPSSTGFALGTGDFTIECWIYPTAWTNDNGTFIDFRQGTGVSSQVKPRLFLTGGTLTLYVSLVNQITTTLASLNTWYHIALVRSSGSTKLYVNGVQGGSTYTDANDYGSVAQDMVIGQVGDLRAFATGYFTGYISNVRIVKGTAVYTAAFTTPYNPLTAITNTQLLLNTPFIPSTGAFLDSSTNGFTVTLNGTPTSSSVSPFTSSGYRLTTNGVLQTTSSFDEITISNTYQQTAYYDGSTSALSFTPTVSNEIGFSSVNAYQLEVFFNSNVAFNTTATPWTSGLVTLFGRKAGSPGTASDRMVVQIANTVTIKVDRSGFSSRLYTVPPLSLNTWYHFAIVRNANNDATAFLNGQRVSKIAAGATPGTSLGQYFNDSTVYSNGPSAVGFDADTTASVMFKGYMTNARIIANASIYNVYSNTIPIPILPLNVFANTGIPANTVLLALQTNLGTANTYDLVGTKLIPNGTFTYTSTAPSNTSFATQRISNTGTFQITGQFDETGAQALSYSNYFPQAGTTQKLVLPYTLGSNLDFLTTSNNWTVECWFNCLYNSAITDGRNTIFSKDSSAGSGKFTGGIWLLVGAVGSGTANTLTLNVGNTSSATVTSCYSQQKITANTWYHVAATRNGANVYLYLNGSLTNTAAVATTSLGYGPLPYTIGQNANGVISSEVFAGYISNFRVINGITQYTSNFTPQFPLGIVPNTVLLTCQSTTIIDNSTQNFTINTTNVTSNTFTPSVQGVFTSSILL